MHRVAIKEEKEGGFCSSRGRGGSMDLAEEGRKGGRKGGREGGRKEGRKEGSARKGVQG